MTVLSMTGFGAARAETVLDDGTQVTVSAEVKSVNHKHLQAKIRLPHELGAIEAALDKLVRSKLTRGAIQVSVDLERIGGSHSFMVDGAVAESYMHAQRELAASLKGYGLREIESMAQLLPLPGVIVSSRSTAAVDADGPEARATHEAVTGALDSLVEMRAVEGEAMRRDLANSGDRVAALVEEIASHMPEVQRLHRERLVERVRELSEGVDTTEADLSREIALLAERLDVSEEIARLHSHLEQLRAVLERGGQVGRKLDFLAQEFFREANTVGSKCSDATVAHLVVDLKTHVERLREQVQNVE